VEPAGNIPSIIDKLNSGKKPGELINRKYAPSVGEWNAAGEKTCNIDIISVICPGLHHRR